MARIVIKCQYTGHYVFTGIEMRPQSQIVGGRVFCPYCAAEHSWSSGEAEFDETQSRKPLVRQAS
jgi:hypothetical protein